MKSQRGIIETLKDRAAARAREAGLLEAPVTIRARVLSPEEAIGNPERDDFPLLKGREAIMEAEFEGCRGHAFSDMYGGFSGRLAEVFAMAPENNYRRGLQVAAMNALVNYWGLAGDTTHCRDGQPGRCAGRVAEEIGREAPGAAKVALVGYQPAMAAALLKRFSLRILDLDPDNVGRVRQGQTVLDGEKDREASFRWADLILATGSSVVNGTIDGIIASARGKPLFFYGVTIASAASLLGLNRICFTDDLPSVSS